MHYGGAVCTAYKGFFFSFSTLILGFLMSQQRVAAMVRSVHRKEKRREGQEVFLKAYTHPLIPTCHLTLLCHNEGLIGPYNRVGVVLSDN